MSLGTNIGIFSQGILKQILKVKKIFIKSKKYILQNIYFFTALRQANETSLCTGSNKTFEIESFNQILTSHGKYERPMALKAASENQTVCWFLSFKVSK